MNGIVEAIVTVALAVVGLAIVSVLVSGKANTAGVIQAGASGLANNLGVAESPVTGANISYTTGYPAANGFGNMFGG
jgi:PRD1 phage membrane DNA delivery